MHNINMHLNLSHAAGPHTSVDYVGSARDAAGGIMAARMEVRAFVEEVVVCTETRASEMEIPVAVELDVDTDLPDAPIIDGAASPHEGLTQTQETQEMEEIVVECLTRMEQGECIVNSVGGDTRVVDGG